MKLIPFIIFLLPTLAFAQHSIARSELIPILEAVHDTLSNHHPFAFVDDGKAKLETTLSGVLARADSLLAANPDDSLAYPVVIGLAEPLQATIGCGHTHLRRKSSPSVKKELNGVYSAVSTFLVADGRYVLNRKLATTKDSLARGTEVLAFEGRPITPLINSLAQFYGVNDHDYVPATAYIIAGNIDYYYRYMLGYKDTLSITVKLEDGVVIRQIPPKPIVAPKRKEKPKPKAIKTPPFYLAFNEDKTVAHLRITSFNDASWKGFNAKRMTANVVAGLRGKGIDKLVIDLRGNLGGNLRRMRNIYRYFATEPFATISKMESYSPDAKPNNPFHALGTYLIGGRRRMAGGYYKPGFYKEVKPLKGNGYRGKLAVLINERTFSAATLFAHLVQATDRGELIGATSGGSTSQTYGGSFNDYPIGAGKQLALHLPDYGIQPWRPRPGNLKPDHLVSYAAEDIAAGRDVRLEFAYDLLLAD